MEKTRASYFLSVSKSTKLDALTLREEAFQNTEELRCPITGEQMILKDSYVAYLAPSFKELADAFKEAEALVISEQLFKPHGDGDLIYELC